MACVSLENLQTTVQKIVYIAVRICELQNNTISQCDWRFFIYFENKILRLKFEGRNLVITTKCVQAISQIKQLLQF